MKKLRLDLDALRGGAVRAGGRRAGAAGTVLGREVETRHVSVCWTMCMTDVTCGC